MCRCETCLFLFILRSWEEVVCLAPKPSKDWGRVYWEEEEGAWEACLAGRRAWGWEVS